MPPPYAAYLRIYEPLPAFPPAEQQYWRQYLASDLVLPRADGARLEHEHALRRMLTGQLPDPGEHAFVTSRGEVPMICPWRTALRAWEAVKELDVGIAGVLEAAYPPPVSAPQPRGRSHIVTSTWAVPVRWFVLFGPEDKLLRVDDDGRELVYVTEMGKARRRAARALASLRKGLGETLVTEAVEELARWLEDFHPRSLVELDYGGLVWLYEPSQLVLDDSASDVAIALRALALGDGMSASAAYERITERWRPAPALGGVQLSRFACPKMTPLGHVGIARERSLLVYCATATGGQQNVGRLAMAIRSPEAEPLLTPAEVATMFRVDPKTVTRWAKAGKLSSIRTLGGHRRYKESEVRSLLGGIPSQREG